ncbi:ABC transporter permease [Nocardioides sp. GXZ039]|uniref:ABC transporter permease n=1 Tax=Nocardioides sp. GXZ039 TaxID=3136018 RepID=UPI0030F46F42
MTLEVARIDPAQEGAPSWGARLKWPLIQTGVLLGLLLGWQVLWQSGVLDHRHFPSVMETIRATFTLLGGAQLWHDLASTLGAWGLGLLLAVAIGVPVGFGLASSDLAYRSCRLIIDFCRSIPPVTLLPVALLLYGTTLDMKVVLILFGCVWVIILQTMYGVRHTDPVALETARAYRVRRRDVALRILLPSAAPYISTGLRISAVTALLIAIGAEIITSADGIGREILLAGNVGALSRMYGLILIASVVGLLINLGFTGVERAAMRSHPSRRRGQA